MVRLQCETPSMHVRPKGAHCPLHAQALNLSGGVASLRRLQTPTGIGNRPLLVTLTLQKASAQSDVRRIGTNGKLLGKVRHLQNRRRYQSITQRLKRILLLNSPLPLVSLSQQIIQRLGHRREVIDEPSVVAHEA